MSPSFSSIIASHLMVQKCKDFLSFWLNLEWRGGGGGGGGGGREGGGGDGLEEEDIQTYIFMIGTTKKFLSNLRMIYTNTQ